MVNQESSYSPASSSVMVFLENGWCEAVADDLGDCRSMYGYTIWKESINILENKEVEKTHLRWKWT